jgi:hypothetical protein
MTHENPALTAALAALEKEAAINPHAAELWRLVEPARECAWNMLRAVAHCDYYRAESAPLLLSILIIELIEGGLPLPRRLLQ